jgi:predicted dehydrogenase
MRIAIVGLGKIARDQHIPAIARSPHFELVAAASPAGSVSGVPIFPDIEQLLVSPIALDAIALCQPPQFRFAAAMTALRAGLHVLLEKPPATSCVQLERLASLATDSQKVLFAAWHSRHAPAVEVAREWLATRRIRGVHIQWKEDVRRWHPNQEWIWQPGGFGVFDPGINALSILTRLMPERLEVRRGKLEQPRNRGVPIAANLELGGASGVSVSIEFDWRQQGPQTWSIGFDTEGGLLELTAGGAALTLNGTALAVPPMDEYGSVYKRFACLVDERRSDVDAEPLRLVAEAFRCCTVSSVDAFES